MIQSRSSSSPLLSPLLADAGENGDQKRRPANVWSHPPMHGRSPLFPLSPLFSGTRGQQPEAIQDDAR